MESMDREVERAGFICLRPSHYSEKPFSRDKPSSPFRFPSHPRPYCHHNPDPGIPLSPPMENEVCGFENLSLSSAHFRPLGYGRMGRDDITHFQEVRSEAEGVGSSMDRCHLPCSSLFHLLDRVFINRDSE